MKRKKLFVHAGFAKCGSTSLQAALSKSVEASYPENGRHGNEHLALALYLRGLDDWTAQWYTQEWVEQSMPAMLKEIKGSQKPIFLSSERLAGVTAPEAQKLSELFSDYDIEVLFVIRSRDKYLDSTWRHAVFCHDYLTSREEFLEKSENFKFEDAIKLFSQYFPVHLFDLNDPRFPADFKAVTSVTLKMEYENVGAPQELIDLLQTLHRLLGTRKFKRMFPKAVKEQMLRTMIGRETPEYIEMDFPLFKDSKSH